MIRAMRCLGMGLAWTAVWPAYLGLLALTVRRGPWPRSVAVPIATILIALALTALARNLLKWLFRPSGWAVCYLDLPRDLSAQIHKSGRSLTLLSLALLLPAYLLAQGEIAPEGRATMAPALSRFLVIAFGGVAWISLIRLSRRGAVAATPEASAETSQADPSQAGPSADPAFSGATDEGRARPLKVCLEWLKRRRRLLPWTANFVVLAIILLEARGYSFTARRMALGLFQSGLVVAIGWAIHRAASKAIAEHPLRWTEPAGGHSWTRTLTSAVATGSRLSAGFSHVRFPTVLGGPPAALAAPIEAAVEIDQAKLLARRLGQLVGFGVMALCGLVLSWVWDLDLALLDALAGKDLWPVDAAGTYVKLGELVKAIVYVLIGVAAWRHMSPLFAIFVFPRMSDDPGVRFAVVTLCRYAVLGLTSILALGAIHLDMSKIGVVVAALGVGLGFGLQEVVSNFVCGIILLLERPIRIGDTVTVAGTSGRVDRINIRATTIVNAENQSMIVPNREFITGNLVNWTYRDKIIRVPIRVGVAYGTDPDRVVDLLQGIARADADVLRNPVPSAQMEGFGDSALLFGLYTFVPDPSLMGRVRHRLCTEIHRRFAEEGIQIPFPIQELHLNRIPDELTRALKAPQPAGIVSPNRVDHSSRTPAGPHSVAGDPAHRPAAVAYKEDYCRGVDE